MHFGGELLGRLSVRSQAQEGRREQEGRYSLASVTVKRNDSMNIFYLLTACWEQCLQVMKDTDRCGRGGGDGGRAVVSAGRLAVRLCGRVQGHGMLGNPALPGVVLCRERVWCRKLCWDSILWGRWVLGCGVRLGHRFWGVSGLLVTLWGKNTQQEASVRSGAEIKVKVHCLTCSSSMKEVRAPCCDVEGIQGELSCKPTKSGGNSHHITSQLRLEKSLIFTNEHSLCCRAWLAVGGAGVRGNLNCTCGKAQEERSINW